MKRMVIKSLGFLHLLLAIVIVANHFRYRAHPPAWNNFGLSIDRAIWESTGNLTAYPAAIPFCISLVLITGNPFLRILSLVPVCLAVILWSAVCLYYMEWPLFLINGLLIGFCLVPLYLAFDDDA